MRVLLSIGCNEYEHVGCLGSAEADAKRMFDALLRPEVGDYDLDRSRLLLSPTIAEVRQAIADILFSCGPIDTFTFFFAGHGGVGAGSFYMYVRDSRAEALSVSAQSLSEILRSVGEAAPNQSYLIIDACESGGLLTDLNVILKRDVIGNAGTPGITLVATSAQDQGAEETQEGGIGTNAILDCIEGRDFIQDNSAMLDLVEIGRRVSTRLRDSNQSPVVWGLNLSGPPGFCRNPSHMKDPARPIRELTQAWPHAAHEALSNHIEQLWNAYVSVSADWEPRKFSATVSKAIAPLAEYPEALGGAIERMATAMQLRAEQSDDPFRPAEVCATLVVCLLPQLKQETVYRSAQRLIQSISATLTSASVQLLADLQAERYALLDSHGGGLSDLYYLPLRIAKLLGWVASASLLCRSCSLAINDVDQAYQSLLRHILGHYSGSIQAISDGQAPYWALALTHAMKLGLRDEAEQLAGSIFHSLVACHGQLSRVNTPPDETLRYLVARHSGDFDSVKELIARPLETLTVLIQAGIALDLTEVFEESLWRLDGLAFFAYIPSNYSSFGLKVVGDGRNLIWTIGHDVFRIADFVRTWPLEFARPESAVEEAITILCSLLYPDRVAWFCFDELPFNRIMSNTDSANNMAS